MEADLGESEALGPWKCARVNFIVIGCGLFNSLGERLRRSAPFRTQLRYRFTVT